VMGWQMMNLLLRRDLSHLEGPWCPEGVNGFLLLFIG
jgi:hypothetical protein